MIKMLLTFAKPHRYWTSEDWCKVLFSGFLTIIQCNSFLYACNMFGELVENGLEKKYQHVELLTIPAYL